ncbi:hypothetical protein TanjilG_30695 [Lupinus angustifolius]|uniref:Tudor domain-containing protein n=1 Tax=Lupinus angustifolius TaxID=3871 RepID=A0A4P1RNQ3_LUPAN|nr:PREDICTED: muscle M-line assembly protein unc-89-like isoform X2 [Lupinus angustifolius]OIW14976.1 hypothetical protein TanjilG_30695 [Lupinus angustifolius]
MEDIEEEVQKTVLPTADSDPELEEKLLEVGGKLVEPPSSVEELLSLLDQVDSFLSRVEQSPSISMQNALSPSLKAFIADELLRHSDADVKVAVASCISEVTRITAPETPYDDDQMKEVFQLIISSFENLYDKTSQSYAKRISILETVAKVRSCVVMLDLECDAQISKMFQHFLKEIREHHPENVFTSMEIIMTLVLEESEDISLELLSPLMDSVKKDNEEVFPIAKKLGVRVLETCATKLKPYLLQAVKSLGISLDDYSTILASICQGASNSLEQNDICVTREQTEDESKLAKQSSEESKQMVKKDITEAVPSHQDIAVRCISPKSVTSNGAAKIGEDFCLGDSKSLKRQEVTDCSDKSKDVSVSGYEEPNGLDTKKVDKREQKPEHPTRKRGRKSSSSTKLVEPFEGHVAANEKEAEKMLDSENHSEEVPSSLHENASVEAAGPSENDKDIDAKISSPKAGHGESEVIGSSPAEGLHDRNHSKKIACAKTKDVHAKEVATEDFSKVNDVTSDSDVKPAKQSAQKALGLKSDLKKTSVADSVKKESVTTSDTDAKKQAAKKSDKINKGDDGSSSRQPEEKKKSGRGKASFEKGVVKSSAKDADVEVVSSPRSGTKSTKNESLVETPKTNVKRKHSSQTGNESDIKEYCENLVGLRIEVWWPDDREFYKGVIDSFDPAVKKHKVNYDDGEVEILHLRKEKWKIIESADSDLDGDAGSDCASHDGSIDMPPRKKGKTIAGDSTKQRKMDASSKSAKEKVISKSKGTSTKSSGKSKDGRKSKDSPTITKSDDEEPGRKIKDNTSKSIAAAQKTTGKSKNTGASKTSKSKDDDISTPKPFKSKEETPKSGKTQKIVASKDGGKSNDNNSGKVKSGLLKRKDSENDASDKYRKVKALSSSKAQGSDAKSGKKRERS